MKTRKCLVSKILLFFCILGNVISCMALEEKSAQMCSANNFLHLNEAITERATFQYQGYKFSVFPQVFSPAIFPDTFFFADNLLIKKGETFCEIGSGTGLIAVIAALRGSNKVMAVDINPHAVANTKYNAVKLGVGNKVSAKKGDVFDPLRKNKQYDVIFWNTLFMHCEKKSLTLLEKALYDRNYKSLQRYLSEADNYLKDDGRLLIGFSKTHGHWEVLEKLARKYNWKLKVIARKCKKLPKIKGGADIISVELVEARKIKNPIKKTFFKKILTFLFNV